MRCCRSLVSSLLNLSNVKIHTSGSDFMVKSSLSREWLECSVVQYCVLQQCLLCKHTFKGRVIHAGTPVNLF